MKNIHLLPTDKSSRLSIKDGILILHRLQWRKGTHHIYITSDEEIKEGSIVKIPCGVGRVKELHWKYGNDFPSYIVEDIFTHKLRFLQKEGELQTNSFRYEDVKKIILTTDQDLIKDGVQAIDDEFLEWFIKNSSCERVEIRKIEDELISPKNPKIRFNALQDPPSFISAESLNNMILTYKYKIMIPNEEPKQEIERGVTITHVGKQETLEEAGMYQQELFNYLYDLGIVALQSEMQEIERIVLGMQQEQNKNKYSEEDLDAFRKFMIQEQNFSKSCLDIFVKQFKKK